VVILVRYKGRIFKNILPSFYPTMKDKLSVTVDRELVAELDRNLPTVIGVNFRNKSHLVDVRIRKYLKGVVADG
jgi:hypothetical protein